MKLLNKISSIFLFFFLLFSATFSSAAYSQVNWQRYDFFNNSGGLNDSASAIAIADNEAADLQNVVFTTSGNWKTRDGYSKLSTSAVTSVTVSSQLSGTGLKFYKKSDGSRYIVGIFANDTIKKMDYGSSGPDGIWDDITGTITISVTNNDLASFAVGEDTLIIEDGVNTTPPYKWNGSNTASLLSGSPPNAKIVSYHKNMAFAAGNNTNPSTLYFSDVGDIENWTSGLSGNVSVETNDGSTIRAIMPGFDALYIFKDNSIWRLTGDDKDTFVLQRMVSDLGVTSPRAVGLIGNEFIFTSSQGNVYIYDGSIGVKLISSKIDGTLESSNFNRFQYVSSDVFDDDYYLAISTVGSNEHDRIMVFDTFNNAWTKFVGINANSIALAEDGTGQNILVFADYGGYVYKYPDGNLDDVSPITANYLTKQYRFPDSSAIKDWKLTRIFANQKGNYNLNVETLTDFVVSGTTHTVNLQGSGALWGTAIFGTSLYGGESLIVGRIEVNQDNADFMQMRLYNDTIDVEVKGWQIFIEKSDRI